MTKKIVLLGSTGSIGTQTLDICRRQGYKILALAAHRNIGLLEAQAREFSPRYVVVTDPDGCKTLKIRLADTAVEVLGGTQALEMIAALEEADLVLNAIVGMAGLCPTLAALRAGKTVALANKETLVAGGRLVMDTAKAHGAAILPVDSEHSAIFQCLQDRVGNPIKKIILTASGGPFFGKTKEELAQVTIAQALNHPNWSMGAKLTVDSATMMNKGLELIEAVWLFGLRPEQVEVVIHRESVLHSAVCFVDHSVIGQMGVPDMRLPIQYAITYPMRVECPVGELDLVEYGTLSFYRPDNETFPCLNLARQAIGAGGLTPCVMNGANEAAVAAFLAGKISFLQIGQVVEAAVAQLGSTADYTLEDLLQADGEARSFVRSYFNF